jgi:FKBP-type peptidyl-prolyl cis-trans isomerase (trigger factor)
MMKKKMIALLLCMTTVLTFGGCGKGGDSDTETKATSTYTGISSAQMDIDLEKQVTKLSDYNGIDLTITGDYDVTDDDVEESILSLLPYYGVTGVEVTDHDTVQEGDYVLIDYTGYKDGEAFDGGTGTDVMFDVSNNYDVTNQNNYIDGFSDGLLGAKVGEKASSDVTFPDDYSTEDLAGQPATFEFDVKGIYAPVTMDNLTDAMVEEAFSSQDESLTTKDALLSYVKSVLESQSDYYKEQAIAEAAQTYIKENSEVDIPDDYLQARLAEYQVSYETDYCDDTQTLEEYFAANDTTLEDQLESWTEVLQEQIAMEFAFGRIADLEDIQVSDDDFSEFVSYLISANSDTFSSKEDVYNYYGTGNQEDGEKTLRQLYRINQAISFVTENANVTVEAETEDSTQE